MIKKDFEHSLHLVTAVSVQVWSEAQIVLIEKDSIILSHYRTRSWDDKKDTDESHIIKSIWKNVVVSYTKWKTLIILECMLCNVTFPFANNIVLWIIYDIWYELLVEVTNGNCYIK